MARCGWFMAVFVGSLARLRFLTQFPFWSLNKVTVYGIRCCSCLHRFLISGIVFIDRNRRQVNSPIKLKPPSMSLSSGLWGMRLSWIQADSCGSKWNLPGIFCVFMRLSPGSCVSFHLHLAEEEQNECPALCSRSIFNHSCSLRQTLRHIKVFFTPVMEI